MNKFMKYQINLKKLLLISLLLILIPTITIETWFLYYTAEKSSTKFQEQLASEISARVYEKVLQFFEVSRLVVNYNKEQFSAGMLDTNHPKEVQKNFLLQLKQQPILTFLSIGTANGEYFAASRPPLGDDKTLRILQSTIKENRIMYLYRVDEDNKLTNLMSVGNPNFDARTRPWFKTAVNTNKHSWYNAYRYAIDDPKGSYNAMGIGMAAPLYNNSKEFIGVITADVSLVQLSSFLANITKDNGGIAFLFDEEGYLLATSSLEKQYELIGNKTVRIKAIESTNPLISNATKIILNDKNNSKSRIVETSNKDNYLLDSWQYTLPDGPTITIANMLPRSQFSEPTRNLFINIFLFSATILTLGFILSIFISNWVSQPLVELGIWATKLGHGKWEETKHQDSLISEVESLSNSLQFMANNIKYNTVNLENEVTKRTQELQQLNKKLEKLSNTDGLTSIANRRYFDEIIVQEVSRAKRKKEYLGLMIIDVDYFKKYNDFYGHQAGDNCLIVFANTIRENLHRQCDFVARYGGEEFVVIVSDCDKKNILNLANILKEKILDLKLPHELSEFGYITASFGTTAIIPDENNNHIQIINIADKALYKAKESGRNCVVFYETIV